MLVLAAPCPDYTEDILGLDYSCSSETPCIYIYTVTSTTTYICIYIYIYVWVCISLFIYLCSYIYISIPTHLYLQPYLYLHIYISIYLYMYISMYLSIYIHVHLYLHLMPVQARPPRTAAAWAPASCGARGDRSRQGRATSSRCLATGRPENAHATIIATVYIYR